jgi:hypothetical protein
MWVKLGHNTVADNLQSLGPHAMYYLEKIHGKGNLIMIITMNTIFYNFFTEAA